MAIAYDFCMFCQSTETEEWWKCCPKHCTEQGPDIVCTKCKKFLHPLCGVVRVSGFGIQQTCVYEKDHNSIHSWARLTSLSAKSIAEGVLSSEEMRNGIDGPPTGSDSETQ